MRECPLICQRRIFHSEVSGFRWNVDDECVFSDHYTIRMIVCILCVDMKMVLVPCV